MGRTIQLGSKRANEVASSDSVGVLFRAGYFKSVVVANDCPQDIHHYPIKVPVGSEDCGKTHQVRTTVLPKGYVMACGQTWPKSKLQPINSDKMPEGLARERSEAFERSLREVKPQTWHAYASARTTKELERMFKYRSIWLRKLLLIGIIFDIVYAAIVFF